MVDCFVNSAKGKVIPIAFVTIATLSAWLAKQDDVTKAWLSSLKLAPKKGMLTLIPDHTGALSRVVCWVDNLADLWNAGGLSTQLPDGVYQFEQGDFSYADYAIAWGLGAYQFTRYKKPDRKPAQLMLPDDISAQVDNIVASIYLVRDWTNTPTEDMGPTELADAASLLAKRYGAKFSQLVGDALLEQNYASIYTVGRASDDAPRLLDLTWGEEHHPKVTLVGKGVCFDSGGLDIKPSAYMLLMRKDMAGGAHVFGLARMIMEAKLPVRLRVLVPAVENVIAGNAYRPGDVIKSRAGLTIEVGNTDCEGRVILADALTEAVSERPELLIDISTLTGAARVALGTELPAVFSNHDAVVGDVIKQGEQVNDPMWRLPLFKPYREHLNSQVADINNNSSESYAGAISAALFLNEFVPNDVPWLHFDLMAWNLKARPGRPQGAEAGALRALFSYLQQRYGNA